MNVINETAADFTISGPSLEAFAGPSPALVRFIDASGNIYYSGLQDFTAQKTLSDVWSKGYGSTDNRCNIALLESGAIWVQVTVTTSASGNNCAPGASVSPCTSFTAQITPDPNTGSAMTVKMPVW